jgi:thiol-disulfide isomerase/thioredoxin
MPLNHQRFFALALLLAFSPFCVRAALHTTPLPAARAAARAAYDRATTLAKQKEKQADATVAAFFEALEADPDFTPAYEGLKDFKDVLRHQASRDPNLNPLAERITTVIQKRYRQLETRFPDSQGVTWGMAMQFSADEDPRAQPYLLKLLAQDPKNARWYAMLSEDAERRGDKKSATEYMHQASLLEPQNADYAFYYASDLHNEAASLDVVKRFPTSSRGAQALYWLAQGAPNDAKRIAYLEQLRTKFPTEKFDWSADGMGDLFNAYLRVDPAKAVGLAQQMQKIGKEKEAKEWASNLTLAQTYIEVNREVAAGKVGEAVALLDKLTPNRYSSDVTMLLLLKARVLAGSGQAQSAYGSLLKQQAQAPDDEILAALHSTGKQLHKTVTQVDADVKALLDAGAKSAPPFDLPQYGSNSTVSLAKLRGKVVFVTFWFPGCGPCRAEMPHLETVLRELHNKDIVYLGINGQRDQDAYVLPFMEKTGYSFIPLKGTDAVTGPKGYKVRGYPLNVLIDRAGRVVYRDFKIDDAHGELMLRRMVESLREPSTTPAS